MSLELRHSGKCCGECLLTIAYIHIMPMRGREKGDIEGRYMLYKSPLTDKGLFEFQNKNNIMKNNQFEG